MVLRLALERSAPLLELDDELLEEVLELDELDRDPELLLEELLSEELPLLSLLLDTEPRFLRSFSRLRPFLSFFSESADADRSRTLKIKRLQISLYFGNFHSKSTFQDITYISEAIPSLFADINGLINEENAIFSVAQAKRDKQNKNGLTF